MKSKSLQQLYAKAAKALEGCEPLTPYETPAYLHEVDRELLVWLFSAALHYGFAQFSRGNRYRSIFLDCPGSPVNVFAKTLPDQVGQGPFILMVGDVCLKPYDVIVVERGLVLWEKSVRPQDVKPGLGRLDADMGYSGHGHRPDPFLGQGLFRVKCVFANPQAAYLLKPSWHERNILEMFDEPERLAVVETHGFRYLALKGTIITVPPVNPETLDQVIDKQYSTGSRS